MANEIIFGPWVGGVTSSSAVIKAAVDKNSSAELILSKSSTLSSPEQHTPTTTSASVEMKVLTFTPDNLLPDTQYHYALKVGAAAPAADRRGRFRTFLPENSAASFTFACAGDAKGGELFSEFSNHKVFDTIRAEKPLFFVHLGDLSYDNVNSRVVADHVESFRGVLNAPRQAELYRNVPVAYTWDDHDYCGDASDGESKGRRAARLAYQRCVPHYPLAEGEGDVAIYHAFTVGRVRFLMTDSRSERSSRKLPDTATKSMLGARQKKWLKDELRAGKDRFPLVVLVSSVPWLGDPKKNPVDTDGWFSYSTERAELGSFIQKNDIRNVLMLSADAHMLALDDGSNNRGATGTGGFPVFQASPLDRTNSKKGKPFAFSHGLFDFDDGQFGLVTVNDSGGPTVQVVLRGRQMQNELLSFTFDSPRAGG
ncbi:MAG TPA: alkaline phosphatase D family protein [Pyrinomonadaceae bacterium]|jgi:alkaline phosphatase D